jgi:cytochrome c biogenesis protein CcmG, thiol:disulfide interchange protein DsbE
MTMNRAIIPLVVSLLLVIVLSIGLTKDPSILPSPFIGKPAPHFELPTLEDPTRRISSADFANKAVLVNVWATWCGGCRQEHPFLLQLKQSGAIPIYGINWRDTPSEARRWLQQLGDPYVASGDDRDGRVGIDWGVYGAPETFLIGADGTVLHKHLGPLSRAVWEQDFVPLLGAGRSGS